MRVHGIGRGKKLINMKIGLITTLETNIGDDFIRDGICFVLRDIFRGQSLEFISVNKHQPLTVYSGWPARVAQMIQFVPKGQTYLKRTLLKVAPMPWESCFDDCDMIVQCGAPVFWPHCHQNEWAQPLWRDVVGRLYGRIPVLNLAAGSCYPWERQPLFIVDPEEAEYVKAILGYCRLTTVRDDLSQSLCASFGRHVPRIPCTAFLASDELKVSSQDDGFVLINYMPGAGHYDWGQNIDASVWQGIMKSLVDRLKKRHRLAFLCHNKVEYDAVKFIDAGLPRLFPKTPKEYFSMVAGVKGAICNRMHASVALAGMGIPAISVGTDSRLLMVKALGLPVFFVKDVDLNLLEESFERLMVATDKEKERKP